ncbi:MAG: S8 family serine peptidase [Clostridia bacterium]|nr:S8 family serine peptidase [Clostridia bacterium]
MKKTSVRIISAFLCMIMIISVSASCTGTSADKSTDMKTDLQSNGNVVIDDEDRYTLSEKSVSPAEIIPEETIAVTVDPFLEEQFLQVIDENDNVDTVRRVADDGEKVIYNISVKSEDATEEKAVEAEEKLKEDISNTIGAMEVVALDDLVIPEADLAKTYKGEINDADGNLLVPYDVAYPEYLDDENASYNEDHFLVKFIKDFDGSVTRELRLCGVSALEKFIEFDDCTWYKAVIADGMNIVSAVKKARSLSIVNAAELDYEYVAESADISEEVVDNPRSSEQWYLNSCGIQEAWAFLEEHDIPAGGAPNVVVAVIDTGVDYNHIDLKPSMWINHAEIPDNGIDDDGNGYIDDVYGVDVISGRGDPMDDHGHGTHVAGIIGAANNKEGIVGIAYNTKIMAVKAGQASGVFNQSDIAEAILYAYTMGADVINMSFAGTAVSLAVEDALQRAYTTCVLVAAAGNNGVNNDPRYDGIPFYPAAFTYVIGVMSVDESLSVLSAFSNYDAPFAYDKWEYEVFAPGERMLSTFPDGRYIYLNGTSMAAPLVSGIAALLRSYYTDRDMYPSRYIAAQLCATSNAVVYHPLFGLLNGFLTNAYDALTKLPKPDIHLLDYYITDNDDYIDAGDTIEIGLTLRNRWGMSADTVVTLETRSVMIDANDGSIIYGPENPYIEVINGIVDFGNIGTYSTKTTLSYNSNQSLSGIERPLILKISEDCPNDYIVIVKVYITYKNALDESDETDYLNDICGEEISFTVRSGVVKRGRITEDETWTKDNLYIIDSILTIEEGATVTVEPGTRIQFYSSVEGFYTGDSIAPAKINVYGSFITLGTEDEPVEIFPASEYDRKYLSVHIKKMDDYISYIRLNYTKIIRPSIVVDTADHCYFSDKGGGHLPSIDLTNAIYTYKVAKFEHINSGWLPSGQVSALNGFSNCIFDSVLCGNDVNIYQASNAPLYATKCFFKNSYISAKKTKYEKCVFYGYNETYTVTTGTFSENAILNKLNDNDIYNWFIVKSGYNSNIREIF